MDEKRFDQLTTNVASATRRAASKGTNLKERPPVPDGPPPSPQGLAAEIEGEGTPHPPLSDEIRTEKAKRQRILDQKRERAIQRGTPGLTNGQLAVLQALLDEPGLIAHAYGLRSKLGEHQIALSDRGITNALERLIDLGIVEKDPNLERNPLGPARQYYRVINHDLAVQAIQHTIEEADAYAASLKRRFASLISST